jgi:hypothetical protein
MYFFVGAGVTGIPVAGALPFAGPKPSLPLAFRLMLLMLIAICFSLLAVVFCYLRYGAERLGDVGTFVTRPRAIFRASPNRCRFGNCLSSTACPI